MLVKDLTAHFGLRQSGLSQQAPTRLRDAGQRRRIIQRRDCYHSIDNRRPLGVRSPPSEHVGEKREDCRSRLRSYKNDQAEEATSIGCRFRSPTTLARTRRTSWRTVDRISLRRDLETVAVASIVMSPNERASGGGRLGPPTARVRPVAVPDDLGDDGSKASGRVELPLHIAWSEPRRTYDLSKPYDRRRVYEQVLSEGSADDIRYYVRAPDLLALWDELVLPDYVRAAWEPWVRARRRV